MDKIHSDFLHILKNALENTSYSIPETYNYEQGIRIAKKHKISAMFYYGLINSGVSAEDSKMQTLFNSTCKDVVTNERQKYELSRIAAAFEEHKIEYMPLKGADLKAMYPKPEMRPMGDIDILIKTVQYRQIKPVMESLGYRECEESNHEYIWRKTNCLVELHKYLIPSYNNDYFSYYGDGWKLAGRTSGTRFELSKEDNFIYLFTHFAKHYRDSGIGLRHIIDIWVYLTRNPELDHDYIHNELKKLQLDEFYINITATLKNWFGDEPSTSVTDFITEFIFNNGVYGTKHTHILAMALRDKKDKKSITGIRFKKLYHSVFVSYKGMCRLYPVLVKWPVLLPFYWVAHLFKRMFLKNKLKSYGSDFALLKEETISEYENALKYVGLGFNFGE